MLKKGIIYPPRSSLINRLADRCCFDSAQHERLGNGLIWPVSPVEPSIVSLRWRIAYGFTAYSLLDPLCHKRLAMPYAISERFTLLLRPFAPPHVWLSIHSRGSWRISIRHSG